MHAWFGFLNVYTLISNVGGALLLPARPRRHRFSYRLSSSAEGVSVLAVRLPGVAVFIPSCSPQAAVVGSKQGRIWQARPAG